MQFIFIKAKALEFIEFTTIRNWFNPYANIITPKKVGSSLTD
jgi:hypothetical protein